MTFTHVHASAPAAASGRIRRHLLVDRIYHWTMAACVLTLMATAFLPIVGYKVESLGRHGTTGVVLSAPLGIHIVRALLWQDFWALVTDARDSGSVWRRLVRFAGGQP